MIAAPIYAYLIGADGRISKRVTIMCDGRWKQKAQRWGTGLIGSISRSAMGSTLSAGQSSCLYNIDHRPPKMGRFYSTVI